MPEVTVSLASTLLMGVQFGFYGRVIRNKGISPNSRYLRRTLKYILDIPSACFPNRQNIQKSMGDFLPGSIQSLVGRKLFAWLALLKNKG